MNLSDLRLRLADRIHEKDLTEICRQACLCNESKETLFRLVTDHDDRVAANALWCFTWFDRDNSRWLSCKRSELIGLALSATHITVRRLSLNLLERMTWQPDDLSAPLIDYCLMRLMSASEPVGLRTLCAKLAFAQCRHYPELLDELRLVLDEIGQQPLSPAIANIRTTLLRKLNLS